MRAGLLAAIAVMLGACVTPNSVFACDMTQQCTVGGTCEPIGCTSDNDCPAPGVNSGGVKNFCTPKLDPTFLPNVGSAITDGP